MAKPLTFTTTIPLTRAIFNISTYTQHLLHVLDFNNNLSLSRDKLLLVDTPVLNPLRVPRNW